MAEMKIDNHSGAIVFHLTPAEKEVQGIKENLSKMEKEMEEKLKMLDELIEDKKAATATTKRSSRKTEKTE